MGYLAVILFTIGYLLWFSGREGHNPMTVLRAVLRNEPLPEPTLTIENTSAPSGAPGPDWQTVGGGGSSTFTGGFARPLAGWKVTSGYGMRWGRMHLGVDVPASTGTPIKAAAAGTVDASGWAAGAGNRVNIKHNSTYETRYFHMSRIAVQRGQRVTQGQVIGYVGSTGDSSGPHLHFEVWKNGSAQNPTGYVR